MKINWIYIFTLIVLAQCSEFNKNQNLLEVRANFKTQLVEKVQMEGKIDKPQTKLFSLVKYQTNLGEMPAYISKPKKKDVKYPAIIWLIGGFSNSISSVAWEKKPI